VAADAAAFGAGADGDLTAEQAAQLRALADARADRALTALVGRRSSAGVHAVDGAGREVGYRGPIERRVGAA
jgi:hypothetical protein